MYTFIKVGSYLKKALPPPKKYLKHGNLDINPLKTPKTNLELEFETWFICMNI